MNFRLHLISEETMYKLLIIIALCFVWAITGFADEAPVIPTQSGNVVPIKHQDIKLTRERIDIYLYRTEYKVKVRYEFFNTGKSQTVIMGFPNRTKSGQYTPIENFKIYDGKKELKTFKKIEEPIGKRKNEVAWFGKKLFECAKVSFKKGERNKIVNTYTQAYVTNYDEAFYKLEYILKTGAYWKGKIKSVKVFIHVRGFLIQELNTRYAEFEGENTIKYKLKIKPEKYKIKSNTIIMDFKNVEPDFNIEIFMPPNLIRYVEATTTLENKTISYSPKNAIDNDKKTAWVEGKTGDGIGESIELNFTPYIAGGKIEGEYYISKIGIINGYAKSREIFFKNNRVKKIELSYINIQGERKIIGKYLLKDTLKIQYISFDQPLLMGNLTLKILEVYQGEKYRDTAISEIFLFPTSKR